MIISVITNEGAQDYYKEIYGILDYPIQIDFYTYQDFNHIGQVYKEIEYRSDGIIVSGMVAKAAIERSLGSVKKTIYTPELDLYLIFKKLLAHLVDEPDTDLGKVVYDYSFMLDEVITVKDLIKLEDPQYEVGKFFQTYIKNAYLEELQGLEEEIFEKALEAYKAGQVQAVICFYGSVAGWLKDQGVPVIYAYPSLSSIKDLTDRLIEEHRLAQVQVSQPLAIKFSFMDQARPNIEDLNRARQAIEDYFPSDLFFQDTPLEYVVITSMKDDLEGFNSKLISHLKESLGYDLAIGYGQGQTSKEALDWANTANAEAKVKGGAFFLNSNQQLVGPLASDQELVVNLEASQADKEIASSSGLSPLTIQKIRAILNKEGTDELTSRQLADGMGSSIRNANRIIQKLEEAGYAEYSGRKSVQTMGRPLNSYKIKF